MLFTLPATAALMVISSPIITVLFEHGEFGPAASKTTADALVAFASGLPAYVLTKVYAPGFFAREDTKSPVIIGIAAMVTNIALSLLLMESLAHVGIALATSLSAWLNAGALLILLHIRGHYSADKRLFRRTLGIIAASLAMAAVLWAVLPFMTPYLQAGLLSRITALCFLIFGGGAVYGVSALLFGAAKLSDLKSMLRRRKTA